MSGKKGMPRYNEKTKGKVIQEYQSGTSVCELSRRYGISRYSIQSWCGLRKEVERRHEAPLPKGRPSTKPETQEKIIKRLQMENELLRNFLSAVGKE